MRRFRCASTWTKLYTIPNFPNTFDAVAVHPFAENEKGVLGGVKRIRKIMDKNGDKRKALWVTEVGFASTGPASPFSTNEKGQAKLLKKVFKTLGKVSNRMKVQRALWFTWRDSDRDPPRFKQNAAGRPTPDCSTIRASRRLRGRPSPRRPAARRAPASFRGSAAKGTVTPYLRNR